MPAMAEFFDVVLGQRACRRFSDEPVGDDVVARILTAATHAPSAENSQPWVFVVVRDAERRARLSEMAQGVWRGWARSYAAPRLSDRILHEVDEGVGELAGAPVIVVVGGDTQECIPEALAESIFPAVQNLLLAARALGLEAALTTLPLYDDAFRELVMLPEHVRAMAVVPLGRPATPLGPPRRRSFAETTYRERFGTPW